MFSIVLLVGLEFSNSVYRVYAVYPVKPQVTMYHPPETKLIIINILKIGKLKSVGGSINDQC